MKGRSHRLPTSDPLDDWVDGSWTVDCVCGVNFDDGEEMVNCDECGVWVHTRCSRYVKGDESFACDKCKNKNNRNDSEETEVAQLLVELPTKTVRLETSYTEMEPAEGPFRIWTETPLEDRVHVQGVPGGDPAVFGGLSSVFTPELWKCRGYVPKKFNFQYREFPCWDNTEKRDDENDKTINNGAGVLFSLSMESMLAAPVNALVDLGGRNAELYDQEGALRDAKTGEGDVAVKNSLSRVKVDSTKLKKEELGTSKDHTSQKKARAAVKESDERTKAIYASKAVLRPTCDAKQFYEDRDPKLHENDLQKMTIKYTKDNLLRDPISDRKLAPKKCADRTNNNEVFSEASLPKGTASIDAGIKDEKGDNQAASRFKRSSKDGNASLFERNNVTEKGDSMTVNKLYDGMGGSGRNVVPSMKSSIDDTTSIGPASKGKQNLEDFSGVISRSSVQTNADKADIRNSRVASSCQSSLLVDVKDPGIVFNNMLDNVKLNHASGSDLQYSPHNIHLVDRSSEAVSDCHIDKADKLSTACCLPNKKLEGSEGSPAEQKDSSESEQASQLHEQPLKHGGASLNTEAPSRKMVVSVGKSSSSSSIIAKTSCNDNFKPPDGQNSDLNYKQRLMSDSNASSKKENSSGDVIRDGDRQDVSRKTVKEHTKSTPSKVSQQNRISHTSIPKRIVSESKDSLPSSSKASSAQKNAVTYCSSEVLENQSASEVPKTLPQKGEKNNEIYSQASFKSPTQLTQAPGPSNSSATLRDEELALLLHQQLNSSPRVPRVPRVRHPGSLPQSASPATTSMLIKRTSSSGGKDDGLVSKKRGRDASKDGFRSSREVDHDAKKTNKARSPDQRIQDNRHTTNASSRREDHAFFVKKNKPPSSTTATNSGPSSSNEGNDHNFSSKRNSPRNTPANDMGQGCSPVHRTLPGLINEIMSEGRRMTYEELCNSVLPHWPNLRKHNGERYAYASHSQAVLDCLRNRHEWAQLVDRGPKTNSSRKRRKFDAEESEDNEYGKGRSSMKETEGKSLKTQREEFPKGKRKARKGRRLALQGRGIKDVRKRRKVEFTDDDSGQFSDSSEESMFSEDEIEDGGVGSEASGSSDEMEM